MKTVISIAIGLLGLLFPYRIGYAEFGDWFKTEADYLDYCQTKRREEIVRYYYSISNMQKNITKWHSKGDKNEIIRKRNLQKEIGKYEEQICVLNSPVIPYLPRQNDPAIQKVYDISHHALFTNASAARDWTLRDSKSTKIHGTLGVIQPKYVYIMKLDGTKQRVNRTSLIEEDRKLVTTIWKEILVEVDAYRKSPKSKPRIFPPTMR